MILPEPHAINRLRHALTRMETAVAGMAFLLLLGLFPDGIPRAWFTRRAHG